MADNRTSTGGLIHYFLRRWSRVVFLVVLLIASAPIMANEGQEPKPAKFAVPVWHPDARWEVEEHFAGSSAPGFLDGPRRQSQPVAGKVDLLYGVTQGGRNLLLSYDAETEMVHIVAGSARGYLDGPFSRARFGRNSYTARPRFVASPDRRYFYLLDAENQLALRRCDLEKQEVTTIRRSVKNFGGMAVDGTGKLLLIEGAKLLWLDEAGKQEKSLRLNVEEPITGIGGAGASLALDEKHGRLYATAFGSKQWYIWYWDLKDGSFHGVLAMPPKDGGRKTNEAGPFEGTRLYNEGSVFFGPDDPDKRFLYTARIDTFGLFRLDLEKQQVAAMTVESQKGKPAVAYFIDEGSPSRAPIYGSARFADDGSILSSVHTPFVATRLKRIN
ncbi:MAG: hypothetical protein ACK4RK_20215 [Gemmataceae bacterium]